MPNKIHTLPLSNSGRVAEMAAHATGTPYELEVCDITVGAHKTDEYTKKNNEQAIPCFEFENGDTFSQSVAIARVLIERSGKSAELLGATERERYDIERAVAFISTELIPVETMVVFNAIAPKFFKADPEKCAAAVAYVRPLLTARLAKMERVYFAQSTSFIVGDKLSLADILAAPHLAHLVLTGGVDLNAENTPKLHAYLEHMKSSVDAYKASHAAFYAELAKAAAAEEEKKA